MGTPEEIDAYKKQIKKALQAAIDANCMTMVFSVQLPEPDADIDLYDQFNMEILLAQSPIETRLFEGMCKKIREEVRNMWAEAHRQYCQDCFPDATLTGPADRTLN